MKHFLLLVALIPTFVMAQDVIVKKDGSTILSKVLEVNTADVKYKKLSNLNGPTYTISKSDILSINYENGEKDMFNVEANASSNQSSVRNVPAPSQVLVQAKPSANNKVLIDKYSADAIIPSGLEISDKDANYTFPIMAVSDSSILSTDDLEMHYVPTVYRSDATGVSSYFGYNIELENKSNRTIYVDLANTFDIYRNNTYKSYFNTEQTTVVQGGSSGGSVGLGGIANVLGVGGTLGTLANSVSVGGTSNNAVMKTNVQQRIMIIPPHSKSNLREFREIHIKKNQYETLQEPLLWGRRVEKGFVKRNEYKEFDESNAPSFSKLIITYSPYQDFSTYSTLYAKVYTRYIVGFFNKWNEMDLSYFGPNNKERAIKRIKEHVQGFVPDFWDNPYRLIGYASWTEKPKN